MDVDLNADLRLECLRLARGDLNAAARLERWVKTGDASEPEFEDSDDFTDFVRQATVI